MPIILNEEQFKQRYGETGLSKFKPQATQIKASQKQPNYFQRVGQEYMQGAKDIVSGVKEAAGQIEKGNILGGVKTAVLRTVGEVAKQTFTPIVKAPGIKQGLEGIGTGILKAIEASNFLLSQTAGRLGSTMVGKGFTFNEPKTKEAISLLSQKVQEFSQSNPTLAKDLQNILDIAVLGLGKTAAKPIQAGLKKETKVVGKVLTKTGQTLETSGIKAGKEVEQSFLRKLVSPIKTKTIKEAQVMRTTETGSGIFKKSIIAPTTQELSAEKALISVKGLSEKNTFQQNFNIIKNTNIKAAKQLETDISKYNFIIPKKEIKSKLFEVKTTLTKSPLITGDAEKTASKLLAGANKFVDGNAGTGLGILKARKQYDFWVESQKPNVFDVKADSAFTIANREIRQTLNNILEEKAPNLGIKDSLKHQSSLYRAMENIAPKAALEADSAFGRALQKTGEILGTKSRIVQGIAAGVGIGGLGAAATFAPAVALLGGTGYVIYRAGKFVLKPAIREYVGKMLKIIGNRLAPVDKKIIEKIYNNTF